MYKVSRFFIPILLAGVLVGLLVLLAGSSSQVMASAITALKELPDRELTRDSSQIYSSLHVTTLEDELNTDGDCSLREAIQAVNSNTSADACGSGDVLTDTITFDVAGMITVNSQLEVTDGGPLVIDGGDAITLSGNNNVRILYMFPASNLTLVNISMENGNVNEEFGGGIYNEGGSLTSIHSTFSYNNARYGGAILNTEAGLVMIIDCIFTSNSADYGGQSIRNFGTMTIESSSFSNHTMLYSQGVIMNDSMMNITGSSFSNNLTGTGLFNTYGATMTIHKTEFINNVGVYGPAIMNTGIVSISNSLFSNNSADAYPGAIYNNTGSMEIINSTITNNSSGENGGGIYNQGGASLSIQNCTIVNNTASSNGGGIAGSGTLTITNSTISGNSAYGGGGLFLWGSSAKSITYSTISGNYAIENGGAINIGSGSASLNSSIVAYSMASENCYGLLIDGGHNIEDADSCGFNPANGSFPNTDPLLGPLQDNGGPTLTHALLKESPAIDAGDDDQCPSTDQRGAIRPVDGDGDGIAICDIGSYEVVIPPENVIISGPNTSFPGRVIYFTATVEPITTTLPLTYSWQTAEHTPITHTAGLSDTVSFTWEIPGTYAITVTASNLASSVSDTYMVTILPQEYKFYLPFISNTVENPQGLLTNSLLPVSMVLVGFSPDVIVISRRER